MYPLGFISVCCTSVFIIFCVYYITEHVPVPPFHVNACVILFLEEIGINSPDEREVILSEIYRRFHPEEEDLFEMEIQGEIKSVLGMSFKRLLLANFTG